VGIRADCVVVEYSSRSYKEDFSLVAAYL